MIAGGRHRPDVAAAKRALRVAAREARDTLPEPYRQDATVAITRGLLARLDADRARVVASYMSFGSEFDTSAFHAGVAARALTLVLPRVDRGHRCLGMFRVADLTRDLVPGVWGILEPDPERCDAVDPNLIEWCLVPGVAFDRAGGRLGYGAGFYDRLLAGNACTKVTAAFQIQIVEQVPSEPHDQRVDVIVTEREEVTVRSS